MKTAILGLAGALFAAKAFGLNVGDKASVVKVSKKR